MKRVGARLRGQVDDAAVEPPELGRRAVALDLELLDRVDDGEEGDLPGLGLENRDAVEEILVRARPAAVDAWKLRPRRKRDAGRERGERDEGAAVERKLDDLLVAHARPEAGAFGPEHRRVGGHLHDLADGPDSEREIHARLLSRDDRDALAPDRREAGQRNLEAVSPGGRLAAV